MARNAQRFANFGRGSNSGSEDQIYDKRRPSTEDAQPSAEYRTASSIEAESTSVNSHQEDRSRSVERQQQSIEKKLREEVRRLQEDLAKASREASSAIDMKDRLERQISEINDKAMEYQTQVEQANAQKTDVMKEKLAVEEKLELQEEMLELKEGFELQMRGDDQSDKRKVSELKKPTGSSSARMKT